MTEEKKPTKPESFLTFLKAMKGEPTKPNSFLTFLKHRDYESQPKEKSLESRTDMTELEEMLINYITKKITGTDNPLTPEGRIREIAGLEQNVHTYIDILVACERKTPRKENDKSFSYFCVISDYHGHNIREIKPNPANEHIEQRLQDLEEIELVDGKRFSFVSTTSPGIYEHGELVVPLNDQTTLKRYRSYIATEKGTTMLREHEKIKSQINISDR